MLTSDVVEMGEVQDLDMAARRTRIGKNTIIEVSPYIEEKVETGVGTSCRVHNDTIYCMDSSMVYQWG